MRTVALHPPPTTHHISHNVIQVSMEAQADIQLMELLAGRFGTGVDPSKHLWGWLGDRLAAAAGLPGAVALELAAGK